MFTGAKIPFDSFYRFVEESGGGGTHGRRRRRLFLRGGMETVGGGLGAESDPRALLLPEAVPVLHSIQISNTDEDSNSQDLPSTVDIAALNVSVP
jgi:hypothetical protein